VFLSTRNPCVLALAMISSPIPDVSAHPERTVLADRMAP
jgi:hypothetical protein